ncbi:MAG: polymerase subunit epsilon [Rhodoferax sp.]|nr:polymerase subunit epsilon [Rhodoferax sp.]
MTRFSALPPIAVIDFETTGISPGQGARATEVAIVLLEDGRVVDRFQSLMNAGVHVPYFITQLTGITNAMVAAAPLAEHVMDDAARFVGDAPMVAHNAAFDRKFWQAELALADCPAEHAFACTVLLSRRLYPAAPNLKLGSLVDFHGLPRFGAAHRALADAEMAAALLGQIQHDLRQRWRVARPEHGLLMALQRCAKPGVGALLAQHAEPAAAPVAASTSADPSSDSSADTLHRPLTAA